MNARNYHRSCNEQILPPRKPRKLRLRRVERGGAEAASLVLLISLEVALEPLHMAIAFKRKDMRGEPVQEEAIMAYDHGAAGEILKRRLKLDSVSTSRSFVGSSSRIRFPPSFSILARCTRLRSPPESWPTFFC